MLVEKITELGVAKFVPVVTEYSNINKLNLKKLRLRAIEAAEQSLRMTVPQIEEPTKFEEILGDWDFSRRLLVLDEFLASNRQVANRGLRMASLKLESDLPTKIAMFVGPEGGFSRQERELLIKCDFAWNIYLGSRLLRSETAAIAAMAIWNELSDIKH